MKFLHLILLGVFFLYSCKSDDCADKQHKPLKENIKGVIPYTNDQRISFKASDNTTRKFIVKRDFHIEKPDLPLICEEYLQVDLLEEYTQKPFAQFIHRGTQDADSMIQITVFPYYQQTGASGYMTQFVLRDNGSFAKFLLNGEVIFHPDITLDNTS